MVIKFDLVQTVGLAVLVYVFGMIIRNHIPVLKKYFIPAPVIGGLIFSILIFLGVQTQTFTVKMTNPLQNFFMNLFFCTTGFTCSLSVIKKVVNKVLSWLWEPSFSFLCRMQWV